MQSYIWLTAAPLLAYVDAMGGAENFPLPVITNQGNDPDDQAIRRETLRAWYDKRQRMTASGKVNFYSADEICIDLLGVHPLQVYGMDWFEVDDESCPILFVADADRAMAAA